jgi:protein-S-isoprenylcysteine O-methyltransferase Ste14
MDGMRICAYLWTGFGILWLLWALKTKPVLARESAGSRISYIIATVAAFYAMFSGELPFGWMQWRILPRTPWIEVLGVVLTVAGLAFAIWARGYLGGNWSSSITLKVGHQLVRTGPIAGYAILSTRG